MAGFRLPAGGCLRAPRPDSKPDLGAPDLYAHGPEAATAPLEPESGLGLANVADSDSTRQARSPARPVARWPSDGPSPSSSIALFKCLTGTVSPKVAGANPWMILPDRHSPWKRGSECTSPHAISACSPCPSPCPWPSLMRQQAPPPQARALLAAPPPPPPPSPPPPHAPSERVAMRPRAPCAQRP